MDHWFRFYNEVLDDPKVQRLPLTLFKGWVNLLCLASRNGGLIPSSDDISFALRVPAETASKMLKSLISAGLIEEYGDEYRPHNWNGRQYKSDVSTERVKRFRKRNETVSETANETPPEQIQSRTDTEQNRADQICRDAVASPKNKGGPLPFESLPDGWRYLAVEMGHQDPDGEFQRLKDWCDSVTPKSKALKRDWKAFWRNWIRKSVDDNRKRTGGSNNSHKRGWIDAALAVGAKIEDPPDVFG